MRELISDLYSNCWLTDMTPYRQPLYNAITDQPMRLSAGTGVHMGNAHRADPNLLGSTAGCAARSHCCCSNPHGHDLDPEIGNHRQQPAGHALVRACFWWL